MDIAINTQNLHPSTEACLEAMQWLHAQQAFSQILDMGCGNGILSVTAAAIWDAQVLAVDIAPKAVQDTQATIAEYALEGRVQALHSDGFYNPNVGKAAPYDLIMCNLLADTLLSMAKTIQKHLKADGFCIFSGILTWRAAEIEQAFTALGFEFIHHITRNPWECFVLRHRPATFEKPHVTKA
ncbi:MAG: 50S ribosomal protein L11 methyltransferase [Rickettsiales bacterium]|nr:50S ribosomal protein L11 methyltransferase [Rickettsiales bacterium]